MLVLLAMADAVAGRFVVEKNSVQVTSPESLKGKYECAIGNFGLPQYGGTLQGWVVYPKDNRQACKEFDVSFKGHKSGARPNFVLIDRGGDSFLFFSVLFGSCFALLRCASFIYLFIMLLMAINITGLVWSFIY